MSKNEKEDDPAHHETLHQSLDQMLQLDLDQQPTASFIFKPNIVDQTTTNETQPFEVLGDGSVILSADTLPSTEECFVLNTTYHFSNRRKIYVQSAVDARCLLVKIRIA